MSTSTTSKPASPGSPEDGDGTKEGDPKLPTARLAKPLKDPEKLEDGPVQGEVEVAIDLEMSRQRPAGWAVFGVIVGALLIWKLGTVGVWVGVGLVIVGIYRAWQLVQTFIYPPGTIVVTDREVSLPRGLCLPKPVKVRPAEVSAVYFLRRSVPWNRSAPVLVIELGPKAMAFPRDWFASEADQRHVVHALLKYRPEVAKAVARETSDDQPDKPAAETA
jgi:hypothetical protein